MTFERYPLLLSAICFGVLVALALFVRTISGEQVSNGSDTSHVDSALQVKLPVIKPDYPSEKLPDFTLFAQGKPRKDAFSNYLAPLIQVVNAHQLEVRRVALLLAKPASLSASQQEWLAQLCNTYRIKSDCQPGEALQQQITRKIDAVPVALAIAQGAKESGWGTSRFARQGNNLFGQWCFRKGCGLIPKNRLQEASHEVAVFASPQAAVAAYVFNLNSHPAYKTLRANRHSNANQKNPQLVQSLTLGLMDYSERGQLYVDELQSLIRHNGSWLSYPSVPVLAKP